MIGHEANEGGEVGALEPSNSDRIGYKRPPQATRFQKGRSGNPKGRPRNRGRDIPYDSVLGQMVTIREDGRERRVTAAEAFLLQLTRKGLAGDSSSARASLAAIETARAANRPAEQSVTVIRIVAISYGISCVMRSLVLGVKKFPLDKQKVRWELKGWLVEAALARLGSRRLSPAEQREVWNATNLPAKVAWPEWWTEGHG
jgi:hypothetical protein